jgi:hypothetical protein
MTSSHKLANHIVNKVVQLGLGEPFDSR